MTESSQISCSYTFHRSWILVVFPKYYSGLTAISTYLLTKELWSPGAGLFAACFIAIVPGYISRSVAGSYDNEGIAIFALQFTYYLWVRASLLSFEEQSVSLVWPSYYSHRFEIKLCHLVGGSDIPVSPSYFFLENCYSSVCVSDVLTSSTLISINGKPPDHHHSMVF